MPTRKRERGRKAKRSREIPASGWGDVLRRFNARLGKDHISIVAAGVAFYGMLAIFPALAALVSIYALVADPADIQNQMTAVQGAVPEEVYSIITRQLQQIAGQSSGALGIGVVISILFALWSAAKGTKSLIIALNIAYREDEQRGFIKLNTVALLLTLMAVLFVIVTLGLIAALPALLGSFGLPSSMEILVSLARWPLLAILVMIGLTVLYRYGPDRDQPRWQWVSWGAFTATVLWLIGSAIFSLYVANFGEYNETYGALAAVVILLLWLYLTAYVILLGAELNAETEPQTRHDTMRGESRPLGERGANMADTVGRGQKDKG
jgi:membrane protein